MNFTNKEQKNISVCPRCDGAMSPKRKTDDKGNTIKIFVCDDCSSIFMYPKTYQIIKDNRLLQEKDAKDKKDKEDKYHPNNWWLFYPYIMSTGSMSHSSIAHFGGGSYGGGGGSDSGSSGRSSSVSSCACVSCACVSACACACACAGGGAAGCAPKDKLNQIDIRKLYKK